MMLAETVFLVMFAVALGLMSIGMSLLVILVLACWLMGAMRVTQRPRRQ